MARDLIAQEEGATYGQGQANVALTYTALVAANGGYFKNDGNVILHFLNYGVGIETATVVSVADVDGRTGDITVSVPAAAAGDPGKGIAGPFSPALFNQTGSSDLGTVFVNTAVADLKVCAIHFIP